MYLSLYHYTEGGIYMASIGSRVKELRMKKGLTQVQLGSLSGIHHTNIGRIENRDAIPQADVLYLIAKNLDTSVEWLLTGVTPLPADDQLLLLNLAKDITKQNESLLLEFYKLYKELTDNEKHEVIRFVKFIMYQRDTEST
jgi:transcriptional regulator with XRE-family HTH domain